MKTRIHLIILAIAASLTLSNCVDIHQVVNLKKDGTGTIEETMLINIPPELAALGGGKDPIADLMKGSSQKTRAKDMGEGVEFVEAKPFAGENGAKGLKTVFKFSDISKVRLGTDGGISAMNPQQKAPKPKKDSEVMRFAFEKGSTSKLTIITPEPTAPGGADQEIDPNQIAMMGQFMKGMRIRVTIDPEGKITKSDATHSDSDTVTLVDMEMDKILSDPAKFKTLNELSKTKDRKKAAATLKEIGVKGETKEKVTVEFK